MLLAIDVGNSSTTGALFAGGTVVARWHLPTAELGDEELAARLLRHKVGARRAESVTGVAVASVVPKCDRMLRGAVARAFGVIPLFITARNAGLDLAVEQPRQVGADRLANAAEAWGRFKSAAIVVDLGTATTLDVITAKGAYAGGAIAPGISLASRALSAAAAKLPRVPFQKPKRVVGRNTKECMQAGLYHGYVGMIDHLVEQSAREMKCEPKVIATGGFAALIAKASATISAVDPDLTLKGIRRIWKHNRNGS